MAVFAVEYVYDPSASETMERIRPDHRAYLGSLAERGVNVASGPWVGSGPGALVIMRADSAEQVEALLDKDPFKVAGVITGRIVREWNPVIGSI
ncbi:hypothetical protein I6B53_05555 [Schaalia sp. 19OD2882]|uniref:YciI family protein n=1 Tax=Schaalia sp. 19OD2882 TaxID=2794089 RepID=UPI001C1F09F2|nr:YciI family protein [Schaalia sp. 19OD2882]QWW20525.1 hypothetical protein I6B53_05555 [Schaalia sp. 19OD2882]